jgi:hypothetical protein
MGYARLDPGLWEMASCFQIFVKLYKEVRYPLPYEIMTFTSECPNVSKLFRIEKLVGKNISRSQTMCDKCWTLDNVAESS